MTILKALIKRLAGHGEVTDLSTETTDPIILQISNWQVQYGPKEVLRKVSLDIERNRITAFIGPSGCGKSTLLRCINRMQEVTNPESQTSGEIKFNGNNIYSDTVVPDDLRRNIGMVFQKPNPFQMSIYENVVYGPKIHGINKKEHNTILERALRQAALWDAVKDKLHEQATSLSGGEQQRLCIARSLAVMPQILLLDEPCAALHPGATMEIEEVLFELAKTTTIVIVTHNMEQARRIANKTAFLYNADHLKKDEPSSLLAYGDNTDIFINLRDKRIEDFVSLRSGPSSSPNPQGPIG